MKFSKYLDFPSLQEKSEPKYQPVDPGLSQQDTRSSCSGSEPINPELLEKYAKPTRARPCTAASKSSLCVMFIACLVTAAATTLLCAVWFQLHTWNHQVPESSLYNPVFSNVPTTKMLWEEDSRFVDSDPHDGKWDWTVGVGGLPTAWDDIYSGAWVEISDPAKYGLSGGVPMSKYSDNPISPQSEAFVVSMLHQIHCVGELKHGLMEVAQGKNISKPEHTTHCIEYLRHAVLCSADFTLERPSYLGDTDFKGSTGWGTTHKCRDWSYIKTFPRPDFRH